MFFVRLVVALVVAALPFNAQAQAQAEAVKGVQIFETPRFDEQDSVIFQLIQSGALDRAAQTVDRLIRRYPDALRLHVVKAEIAISQNDMETAFGALTAASSLGYSGLERTLSAPAFRKLADDERMQALRATAAAPIAKALFSLG